MSLTERAARELIEEIETVLAAGVTTHSVDGTTTTFDHSSMRKELRRLQKSLPEFQRRRPAAARVNLGGF